MFEVKTYRKGKDIKIMMQPCADDKRKFMYRVINCETGEQQWVMKEWLLSNKEQIKNLSVSGVNLKAKATSQRDKCANLNFDTQYNVKYDVRKFIDLNLGEILCNAELYPVAIQPAKMRDQHAFCCNNLKPQGVSARELVKGMLYFGHIFMVKKLSDSSCELSIILNLSNLYDYEVMLNARWGVVETFAKKEYKLGIVNVTKGKQGSSTHLIYAQYNDESLYTDATCVKQILVSVYNKIKEFVIENFLLFKANLFLSADEQSIPWVEVDKANNGYLPNGKIVVKKAFELEKKGYKIVVNDVTMTAQMFENKRKMEIDTSSTFSSRGYSVIREFVDKKNKVYYVKLGDVKGCSMYC